MDIKLKKRLALLRSKIGSDDLRKKLLKAGCSYRLASYIISGTYNKKLRTQTKTMLERVVISSARRN